MIERSSEERVAGARDLFCPPVKEASGYCAERGR